MPYIVFMAIVILSFVVQVLLEYRESKKSKTWRY